MKFTAIDINPIGSFDPKYGQRMWGRVEDSDMPVSFNLMQPVDIPIGAAIEFEERVIKETGPQSKNPGSEYLFLRKVKVGGGIPHQSSPTNTLQSPPNEVIAKLDEILAILKKQPQKSLGEAWKETTQKEDVVDEDLGDEAMNLDQIPF